MRNNLMLASRSSFKLLNQMLSILKISSKKNQLENEVMWPMLEVRNHFQGDVESPLC